MLHGEVLQVTREMKRYDILVRVPRVYVRNAPLIQTFSRAFASLHSSTLNSRNLAFVFRFTPKFRVAKERIERLKIQID